MKLRPDFSPLVAVASCAVDDADYRSLPGREQVLRPNAAQARRKQFAAGRIAGRRAIAAIDPAFAQHPITIGSGREPIWPEGICGSISHAGGLAIAAAARVDSVLALGVDLELSGREINPKVSDKICTAGERAALAGLGADARNRRLLAMFSAKESIYKGLYPQVRRFFGYKAVELSPIGDGFNARLATALGPGFSAGFTFFVGCKSDDTFLLTWLEIAAEGGAVCSGS